MKGRTESGARALKAAPSRSVTPKTRHNQLANEATELFAWLIARSGSDRELAWRLLRKKLRQIPATIGREQSRNALADHGAHVLTMWNVTPAYLDDQGQPIPLPIRGESPSIEALIKLSRRNLTVDEAMDYLCAARAVRKRKGLYVPVSRVAFHLADTRYQAQHHLRVAAGLLRTVERNSRRRQYFEAAADGLIPASKRQAFLTEFRRVGMDMLQLADAFMAKQSKPARYKATPVPLNVGVFVFEESPALMDKTAHSPSRSPAARRKRG